MHPGHPCHPPGTALRIENILRKPGGAPTALCQTAAKKSLQCLCKENLGFTSLSHPSAPDLQWDSEQNTVPLWFHVLDIICCLFWGMINSRNVLSEQFKSPLTHTSNEKLTVMKSNSLIEFKIYLPFCLQYHLPLWFISNSAFALTTEASLVSFGKCTGDI